MLTTQFKCRACDIHDNKYRYSISQVTIITKDKITCVCPVHGPFLTRVHDHLYKNAGCKQCADVAKSNRDCFIELAQKQHESKYDYSKTLYSNNYTPVIITCPKHGDFLQVPSVHLSAVTGCVSCDTESKTLSLEDFITKAKSIHGNTYEYSDVNYITIKQKVSILCKIHGHFTQTPDNHIYRGAGCPMCANQKKTGMYNAHHIQTKNITNDTIGILYLALFESPQERFIKIGITTRNGVKYRYGKHHKGYTISKLFEQQMNILDANKIEQETIQTFDTEKYTPNVKFGGYTECFNPSLHQQLLQFIQK